MTLQVLMPMAGLGSRFQIGDKAILKPLISVAGKPMYQRAIDSLLKTHPDLHLHFVIKQADQEQYHFGTVLKKDFSKSFVITLPQMTRGALETCYLGSEKLNPEWPLIILDCDFEFSSKAFFSYIMKDHGDSEAGALVSFSSQNPRYSYARLENEKVVETAEKKVISSNALAGAYFFCKASYFIEEAKNVLAESLHEKNEKVFYIAPLYNRFIKQGKNISLFALEHYVSFGTPEELQKSGYHE